MEIQEYEARLQALEQENVHLRQEAASVAEANVYAAELMEALEETQQALQSRTSVLERTEAELREKSRVLEQILNSMSDGVVVVDRRGRILRSNPKAAGILFHDPSGLSLEECWSRLGVSGQGSELPLARALKGEAVGPVDVQIRDEATGEPHWLSVTASPLGDGEGAVAVFRDITERQRVQAQLEEAKEVAESASRAKSHFLASMSHELRTPLNAIILYSELLAEEAEDLGEGAFVEDLQKIRGAAGHLLALINDILDISKIEAGKMDLFLETFEAAATVQDVAGTVRSLAEKNSNRLEVACPADLGPMHSDQTKVRQCLLNLLANACKFTREGVVRLEAAREDRDGEAWIRFEVSDTGIGMTVEQVDTLFRDFHQVDSSAARKYEGTGLGLALTRRFCTLLGGEVGAVSEAGRGSTFTVRVPAHLAPAADAPKPPPADPEPVGDLPEVLVVDDDVRVHGVMARILQREGFRALLAGSGEEGLRLARERRPRAILLDVIMPGMDGWQVLATLKSDPDLAGIPVIMVSIVESRSMALSLGVADFLIKPFDRGRLAEMLDRHARGGPGGRRGRILVVEDDAEFRAALVKMLEKEGWSVDQAGDGRAALALAGASAPDLILLDLVLPEMDGFRFLDEVRRREENGAVPVVVLSARDLSEGERNRLNGTVERILLKGDVGERDLVREIRRLVPGLPVGGA